ncbi:MULTISPECIES: transcription antitermination factor NusB [Staphylococcus]|jgi:N utilization substance protein B|uniref:Transcription antitermination protein NusB n=2 Tax=Staphylococcus TaxID=1279 RepID=A0A8X8GVQ2_STAHO|nr:MULTISPECIES: transcription antitermination factor NusB [Staphylococcus]EUZ70444.1 transcription antitermination factor NusB [Staphylococcus sp. M0480]KAB2206340.1 transcription antitermination factor NusB [Staphylococcus epidermidis]OFK81926.1 N utilization substance protein B [Staphylococcus sp. HMSC057A02]OFM56912.1 N utilization substance protein B [Staphylococcus sp. HMSC059G05]OFM61840.1 N utilization substance protein B [Staphylococcus sp. HMSC062C01]OFM66815.1 N utilization substan
MSRKESRKQAFQTLFQLEMKNTDLTINEAINFIKDDYPDLDFEFIHWLVTGVKDHEQVLDQTIEPKLKDWSIQRLLKTDRIILRMATFELLHSDTPPKVIINEAVELTKQFSDEGHYKFINGVLSNIK